MRKTLLLAAALVSCVGCVSQGKYDQAVHSGDVARTALQHETALDKADAKERDALRDELATEKSTSAQLRDSLASANAGTAALAIQKEALSTSLDRTRRAQAAAEARARFFHDLAVQLKGMIDAGQLSVVVRDGRIVLQLPTDVLFPSGQADVKATARPTLKSVATILKSYPDRDFQVAGHTDNVPIGNDRYASNWELASARALEVVRILEANGVNPVALSAASYSEYDPVATNTDEKGRAKNRRIEITVVPNIDELVWVPDNR